MNPFYTIASKSSIDDKWIFKVKLNSMNKVYEGHFPDLAVTPGALLVQLIKELVEEALNKKIRMKEAVNIKFLKMILPSNDLEMEVILSINQNAGLNVSGEIKVKNTACFKIFSLYM